jgi:ElaB/YqjD/DUF883 family membrane-anchored ribosome-binding protein
MNNLNDAAVKPVKDDLELIADEAIETTEAAVENTEAAGTLNLVKEELKNKFSQFEDKANIYKEKVSDNLSGAAGKVHEKSDTAQEYLNQKADSVNDFAHQTIGKANELGHRAAEALNTSSDYVRNFDLEEAGTRIKTTVQQRPEISIAVAGIFGLMLGLLIGRRVR